MDRRRLGIMVAVAFAVAGGLVAKAQTGAFGGPPPRLIPYTGYLESNGVPANGTYNMTFELFPSEADGTALGTPETHAVDVAQGRFSVTLGTSAPGGIDATVATLFDNSELWLQISVDDPADAAPASVLTGRQRLLAAPYALHADKARRADSFEVGGPGHLRLTAYTIRAPHDIHLIPDDTNFEGGTLHVQGGLETVSTAHFWKDVNIDGNLTLGGSFLNHGSCYVEAGASGTTAFTDCGAYDRRFCFLSRFITEDNGSGTDSCQVFASGAPLTWRLRADGVNTYCRADCIYW